MTQDDGIEEDGFTGPDEAAERLTAALAGPPATNREGALLNEVGRLRSRIAAMDEDYEALCRLVPDPDEVVVRRDDLRVAMNYLPAHWAGPAAGLDRLRAAAGDGS